MHVNVNANARGHACYSQLNTVSQAYCPDVSANVLNKSQLFPVNSNKFKM